MNTAKEQASSSVARVDKAFSDAEGKWKGVSMTLGELFGVSPQSQVLGAIKSMRSLGFEPWRSRVDKLKADDAEGWRQWTQDGNDMLVNLAGIAQDAQYAALDQILVSTVTETAKDVKATATAVWNAKWMLFAALALAAYVVWRSK